jgi:HlyD family secretion protein
MGELPEGAGVRFRWTKVASRVGWALLAAAAVAFVVWKLSAPIRVEVIHPKHGELVQEVFGTGTLEAKVVVVLSAKITGKVAEVFVDQGDTVAQGQVVARLEATDYENSVRLAEAALRRAQAQRAKAERDVSRNREMLRKNYISESTFDDLTTGSQVAEAQAKSAEADLGFAKARLTDTVIRSPVAGLVTVRSLEVGDTVVPGTAIFRIADTQKLWIEAMVDEQQAGVLQPGQPARITFRSQPGKAYPGRLERLAREADRVTEEREADVTVDRLPPDWFIGAKADAYIETGRQKDALHVPSRALVPRGGRRGVFVAEDGHARWKLVQVGLTGRDTVEITGGVDAGTCVVADPFVNKKPLEDGQRIAPFTTPDKP